MLEIKDLVVAYGAVQAVRGVSLSAQPGYITAILGANGAGKSSVIRAIAGLAASTGRIALDGTDISDLAPHRRAARGLACVLEGRRLFRELTVQENLEVAWRFGARSASFRSLRDLVFQTFPVLAEKQAVASGLLSGGQQQMLIISSTTVRSPRFLLLDEPSLGLAPVIVQQVFDFIVQSNREFRTTVLMTEQVAGLALRIADAGYVMRQGAVMAQGDRAHLLELQANQTLAATYL